MLDKINLTFSRLGQEPKINEIEFMISQLVLLIPDIPVRCVLKAMDTAILESWDKSYRLNVYDLVKWSKIQFVRDYPSRQERKVTL
jgi:hypothetical protein